MSKEIALTPAGQVKLEQELRDLETRGRKEVGERIRQAREFGDISENSEYDDAKNEQAWIESRIQEINLILANATIIDAPKTSTRVTLGCHVELEDERDGSTRRYQVVGSAEADPANNMISNESPVGLAIMGHKKGDMVGVTTPRGSVIDYRIVKISR